MSVSPKFINSTQDVATQAIEGLLLTRPDLTVVPEAPNVIVQRNIVKGRVALICGGGSGHEPAHGGFVADGWLTAAVCGGVFASPSHASVVAAIRHVARANADAGVLVLIKNYGGDVINFTYAAAIASNETKVETFVIGDDVAFGANHDGQRGIAGTVLLYKLLGAAAQSGAALKDLVILARNWALGLRSLGASLSSCAVPGMPPTGGNFPHDVYELGLGIHGEAGKERVALESCNSVAARMIAHIGNPPAFDPDQCRSLLPEGESTRQWWSTPGQRVIAFVNNLGATTDIEMQIFTLACVNYLRSQACGNVVVERIVTGRSMTALDMHGVSLSILQIPNDDNQTIGFLDAPNPSLIGSFSVTPPVVAESGTTFSNTANLKQRLESLPQIERTSLLGQRTDFVIRLALVVCAQLETKEAELNALDAIVGDGDIGSGLSRAAASIATLLNLMTANSASVPSPDSLFALVAEVLADSFAGTSGPLLGALIAAAAPHASATNPVEALVDGLRAGVHALRTVGRSQPGDRTMVDVWVPVVARLEGLRSHTTITSALLEQVLETATESANNTVALKARKGRARYSNGREIGQREPGCDMVVCILNEIRNAF